MQMPIVEMLENYAKQNNARFHMPCHKGVAQDFAYSKVFESVLPYDITELDFSDNLLNPDGVIYEAQKLYADLYGAEQCFFTTNGSTCGVLSMLASADGDILVERGSHSSVFNGLSVFGKTAVVLNNHIKDGRFLPVTLRQVEIAVKENKNIKTVLLTSPNYYGETCDLQSIYAFCKSCGISLFVDGAHGAHFAFSALLSEGIAKNCDACVTSAHKTLPAMTQTALVFANDGKLAKKIKANLNKFNSSSPNYLLMASLDFARAYLQDKILQGADKRVYDEIKEIKSIKGLSFLDNDDFCRLVLCDTDGKKAAEYLRQKGIYAEFWDLSRVVFIVSLAESMQNLLKLKRALQDMPKFVSPAAMNIDYAEPYSFLKTVDGEVMEVETEKADGFVCAEQCGVYPPCIPLFLRGEKIRNASYLKNFDGLFGVYDGKIRVYKK